MALNTIEKYLKESEPQNYNFELEFDEGTEHEKYQKMGSIERFFVFKATGLKPKYKYKFTNEYIKAAKKNYPTVVTQQSDCDGCRQEGNSRLIREIYTTLFDWQQEKGSFRQLNKNIFKCEFGGDTMNSALHVMNEIVQDIMNKSGNEILKKGNSNSSIGYILNLFNDSETSETLMRELCGTQYLEEYLDYYHTIGNFTLVPEGFNRGRGGNDYWDYALNTLKNKGFGEFEASNFTSYINWFYLWDYLNEDGSIKPLKISGKYSAAEFVKKAVSLIKRRGVFMITMLRLSYLPEFDIIREAVFYNSQTIYSGYDDVIEKLKEKLNDNRKAQQLLEKCRDEINNIKI